MQYLNLPDGTYNPQSLEPVTFNSGYIVGISGYIINNDDYNAPSQIESAIELVRTKCLKSGSTIYLGIWTDNNLTYVDGSMHLTDYNTAISVARKCDQLSIWDCTNNQAIRSDSAYIATYNGVVGYSTYSEAHALDIAKGRYSKLHQVLIK